jgi:hypothetical protein
MRVWREPRWVVVVVKACERYSVPLSVSTRSSCQPNPAEIGCDASCEAAGVGGGWLVVGAGDELGPGVAGVAVDRGQLPNRVAGAAQPADVEAVHPDQLAGPRHLDVRFGAGWRGGW